MAMRRATRNSQPLATGCRATSAGLAGQHEKRCLKGVVGIGGIVQYRTGHDLHHPTVTAHQFRERGFIALGCEAFQQRAIGEAISGRRPLKKSQEIAELPCHHDYFIPRRCVGLHQYLSGRASAVAKKIGFD